eukprot:Skav229023  [mRNA]  locus=scaffold127:571446:572009:- [translate_table: standard]
MSKTKSYVAALRRLWCDRQSPITLGVGVWAELCEEYSDDWYTRNMPRLRDQFRPIFVQEMKRMRDREVSLKHFADQCADTLTAKANGYDAGAGDLLDLGPAPSPAPAAPTGSVDLLDM